MGKVSYLSAMALARRAVLNSFPNATDLAEVARLSFCVARVGGGGGGDGGGVGMGGWAWDGGGRSVSEGANNGMRPQGPQKTQR